MNHEIASPGFEPETFATRGRLLTVFLLGLALAILAGCGSPEPPPSPHHLLLLADVASIGGEDGLPEELNRQVIERFHRWAEHAVPTSRAELAVFSSADAALEVGIDWSTEIPHARAPVAQRRARFVEDAGKELADRLHEVEPVQGSPLFESIWRVERRGAGLGGTYEVVVVSDLLQTSSLVEFTRLYLDQHEDGEIVGHIVAALPSPEKQPTRLTLLYAPGDPKSGQRVTGEYEARLQGLFRQVVVEGWKLPSDRIEVRDYL